jgi:hypothetical protein
MCSVNRASIGESNFKVTILFIQHMYFHTVSHLLSVQYVLQTFIYPAANSGVPRNFIWGGVSTNSVEDRENGDLGAVAP